MSKLNKKIKFTGKIEIITGIHIGDSKENIQIGGLIRRLYEEKIITSLLFLAVP